MKPLPAAGPNAEQITYWNESAGPKWSTLQALIDEQLRALGLLAMERANPRPGERALDVGCGCGEATLELARRVAPGGAVTGIDVSAPMLERAAAQSPVPGVDLRFELADAQTHAFAPEAFDLLYSRFGVMFFADPDAAFANLIRALKRGGRLAFICWQSPQDNPWMTVPLDAALQHVPAPSPPPPATAPGPFAFADPERVRGILTRAGFVNVALEPVRMMLTLGGGGDLDTAVDYVMRIGPTSRLLEEAGNPALRPRVIAAIRAALVPFATARGVRMDSATWIATAWRR
ncbi:MAG: class I SAM-dependent methyltransferase [Candidatus Binatia bacterium]